MKHFNSLQPRPASQHPNSYNYMSLDVQFGAHLCVGPFLRQLGGHFFIQSFCFIFVSYPFASTCSELPEETMKLTISISIDCILHVISCSFLVINALITGIHDFQAIIISLGATSACRGLSVIYRTQKMRGAHNFMAAFLYTSFHSKFNSLQHIKLQYLKYYFLRIYL